MKQKQKKTDYQKFVEKKGFQFSLQQGTNYAYTDEKGIILNFNVSGEFVFAYFLTKDKDIVIRTAKCFDLGDDKWFDEMYELMKKYIQPYEWEDDDL